MEKRKILAAVIQVMRDELSLLNRAAEDARSGATDSEVLSESKYDTRGLESSYLARGHAMKFEALAEDVALLENLEYRNLDPDEPVALGSLVEVEMGRESMFFFLLPKGGGIEVELEGWGDEVTVVTPESPMGGKLLGLRGGDGFMLNKGQAKARIKSNQ